MEFVKKSGDSILANFIIECAKYRSSGSEERLSIATGILYSYILSDYSDVKTSEHESHLKRSKVRFKTK